MTAKLAAVLTVHNEEKQLDTCLQSVGFVDEIVVVLDRCTDGTKAIAEKYNAILVEGAWPIEGHRRNAGLDATDADWLFELDADERVTPELGTEIRQFINSHDTGYALVPFDNYIGDRLVRYGWGCSWGVSSAPRLHAKGCKRWGEQRVHPSIVLKGPEHRLNARIDHYVDRNIADMLKRLDSYSTAKARDLREQPDGVGYARNIRRMFSRFYKCYVTRKGYREGKYGFLIALMAGLYPILSYLKANLEDE